MGRKLQLWRRSLARKRTSHYSGPLNEPIRIAVPQPLGLWDLASFDAEAAFDEILRRVMAERSAKFGLLLQHYGINAKDPALKEKLIASLILDHVPGMRWVSHEERRGPRRRPRDKWVFQAFNLNENSFGKSIRT